MRPLCRALLVCLLLSSVALAAGPGVKVYADGFKGTENLAFDGAGNLYVSDTNSLWRVGMDGSIHKVYTRADADGISLGGVSLGPGGKIYFSVGNSIKTLDPADDSISEFVSGFKFANGNCFDDAGDFFVADSGYGALYVVPAGSAEKRVVKEAGSTKGLGVNGLVWSRNDNTLYFTVNMPAKVVALKLSDDLQILEERTITRFGLTVLDDLTMDDDGNLYVCMWMAGKVMRVNQDGKKQVLLNKIDGPSAPAFGIGDKAGKLYITVKGGNTKFKGTQVIVVDTDVKGYRLPFLP